MKYESGKRLRQSSSALRDYGVMKWRATAGEVASLFSYCCLHPSNFLFLPFSVSRYFWRRLLGLSGMVRSMRSSANNLSSERLKFPVREL
jgi:hypothetical protein